MGGFAGSHHGTVAQLEERGEARLICTCDPRAAEFGPQQEQWRFAQRGVKVFDDYRIMLEACHTELDAVVVPTPIQLHAEMHASAAAFGLPCYLEKPATLDHAELEGMIALDARLSKASLVGFNFVIEKPRLALKERLLAGEFGGMRGATLTAVWPRPTIYFQRNEWAGRLVVGDHVVIDSCLGNALAHFVYDLLFWAGRSSVYSCAQLAAVRAELYRAHAIEGADTFFVEADTSTGVTMRFALSHACSGPSSQSEEVICERATVRYVVGQHAEVRWTDGRVERIGLEPFDSLAENHLEYYRYLRGDSPRPAATLADSRPFVALNNLAYVSSGEISAIPPELISPERDEKEQKDYLNVRGLQAAQDQFILRGTWPSVAGWRREPGVVATLSDLPRFHDVVRGMAQR
ncbi:oxidoreductase domain protein [Opitutus terrae PB90-1]|uniref:Oxidoreductase domain protein n=2 Tax=Opitutus terrae TaxID=107709 RepID=B1ZTH5_OPITP|nr:oxidoreductase domain protein [Opitutus terrae PB90-1]